MGSVDCPCAPDPVASAGCQQEGRWRDTRYVNGAWIAIHSYAIVARAWPSCVPGWLRPLSWASAASTPPTMCPTRLSCPCLVSYTIRRVVLCGHDTCHHPHGVELVAPACGCGAAAAAGPPRPHVS